MGTIISLLGFFGASIGAIIIHLIAHDVHSYCPRVARKLIDWAVLLLPPWAHERYSEEWLADLEQREGVFAKLRHSIECLLCARDQAETLRRKIVVFEFASGRKIAIDITTKADSDQVAA